MPKNNRPCNSVCRSVSFDTNVFNQMEIRRKALRLTRSTFIRYVLEDRLGIIQRPLLDEVRGDLTGTAIPEAE